MNRLEITKINIEDLKHNLTQSDWSTLDKFIENDKMISYESFKLLPSKECKAYVVAFYENKFGESFVQKEWNLEFYYYRKIKVALGVIKTKSIEVKVVNPPRDKVSHKKTYGEPNSNSPILNVIECLKTLNKDQKESNTQIMEILNSIKNNETTLIKPINKNIFSINLNGEFSSEELKERLMNISSLTGKNKVYNLELSLSEIKSVE